MIQVCSRCATRWNVHDRQRVWCPRCQGTLLAPTATPPDPRWSPGSATAPATYGTAAPTPPGPPSRLPAGYRWIAVRPGAAPPARRPARHAGPTPHYREIPRWGLEDHGPAPAATEPPAVRRGPSPAAVTATVVVAAVALGVAALGHLLRYVLLLVNRSTLLDPIVAAGATWLGIASSVVAFFATIAATIVLTAWLVARRRDAYSAAGTEDPRSRRQLWLCCLVPLVNLLWAPVFLLDLAAVEARVTRLRAAIVTWWAVWVVGTVLTVVSIVHSAVVTFVTRDAQGVADDTVLALAATLAALATLLLAQRVRRGFERAPVDRPVRRWVLVDDADTPAVPDESPAAVEPGRKEPAA